MTIYNFTMIFSILENKQIMDKKIKFLTLASLVLASSASAQTAEMNSKLNEIEVTGHHHLTEIKHSSQITTKIEREELTQNERTNILPTLTEQVPGLIATGRGMMGYGVSGGSAGGMMLRGISSGAGQVLVVIDGTPQYNGVFGHSIADSYQTMNVGKVEVLRGPASLIYGSNAMGGVISIESRKMEKDGVLNNINLGGGSYGTVQAEASNQYKKGKFSSTLAGQYNRTDNHRPNMEFEQFGGFGKANYDFNENWRGNISADVTHFNASYPGTINVPMEEADQWITRGNVSVGLDNFYEIANHCHTEGRLTIFDNFGRHKINDGYKKEGGTPQKNLFRSEDAIMGASLYQDVHIWSFSQIRAGVDYQHIYGHTWYTNRETGEEVENGTKQSGEESNDEIAGYININQSLTRWLSINAGIRYDYHTITKGEWIPQAGIEINPIKNGEIQLMASKGFRNPTMKEMYLYPPSNTDLEPERLWNYELSWRHHISNNRLNYGVNVFYTEADNIIQTVAVENGKKNINTGELKNCGAEADANFQINKHWRLNTNHSYLHMETPVVSAPTYKGYLGIATQYGRWKANVGVMQVNGLYTQVGDAETKEDFTLVNATVGFQACKWLNIWAKGDNLLAQEYEYIAGMPMPKATFMGGVNIEF